MARARRRNGSRVCRDRGRHMSGADRKVADRAALAAALAGRRSDCGVAFDAEAAIYQCVRCGLGWAEGAAGPPCFPVVTFDEMAAAAERARDDLMRMQRNGAELALYQLKDMMAQAALGRLLDLVTCNPKIMDLVQKVGRDARARSEAEAKAAKKTATDDAGAATK